jgi:hypothetical protein
MAKRPIVDALKRLSYHRGAIDERGGRHERLAGSIRIELEASTVGFLAISPWPNGPPYPQLERAFAEGDEMRFWVRFPPQLRGDGTVSARTRRTVIRRYVDQLEFEW